MNKHKMTLQQIVTADNERVIVAVWRDESGLKVSAVEVDNAWVSLGRGGEIFEEAVKAMGEGFSVARQDVKIQHD